MESVMTKDNDSDFGYDFSPEEELMFIELASHDHPSGFTTAGLEVAHPIAVIDALPGKSENGSCNLAPPDLEDTSARPWPPGAIQDSIGQTSSSTGVPLDTTTQYPTVPVYPSAGEGEGAKTEAAATAAPPTAPEPAEPVEDDRSPLQKFRTYPKRPLAVSDLTSAAWCELQYYFTLTRLPGGRRTRTAVMKEGSKIHQKLEDEVHTTVQVDVSTREDRFGVKLWNLVSSFRLLRETGLTREVEVWGFIDGNLVNGVIDCLSYDNPNAKFEEELSSQGSQTDQRQPALTDFFPPKDPEKTKAGPKIYLTDVKTRGSLSPPSQVLIRPAKIQLLLYHRMLGDMAAGQLDFIKVFRRYGLDPDSQFSDTFMAQMGNLHEEMFAESGEASADDVSEPAAEGSSSLSPYLKYNNLRELSRLVEEELAATFPQQEDSLGNMLRVEYIYRLDERKLAQHDFPSSRPALEEYLDEHLKWWRGEREAHGVEIEEAFKCRSCEFAADCTWRQGMDVARVRKAQDKMKSNGRRATP